MKLTTGFQKAVLRQEDSEEERLSHSLDVEIKIEKRYN